MQLENSKLETSKLAYSNLKTELINDIKLFIRSLHRNHTETALNFIKFNEYTTLSYSEDSGEYTQRIIGLDIRDNNVKLIIDTDSELEYRDIDEPNEIDESDGEITYKEHLMVIFMDLSDLEMLPLFDIYEILANNLYTQSTDDNLLEYFF